MGVRSLLTDKILTGILAAVLYLSTDSIDLVAAYSGIMQCLFVAKGAFGMYRCGQQADKKHRNKYRQRSNFHTARLLLEKRKLLTVADVFVLLAVARVLVSHRACSLPRKGVNRMPFSAGFRSS
jgi:hypothetical protein